MCIQILVHQTILSDNGMEFKKALFAWVASILGIQQIHSSPYFPWGSRCIENIQNFLKTCIHKHVSSQLAWDEVARIAYAAYDFVPKKHSKESKFFLMFGKDVYTPPEHLNQKIRYMGDAKSLLALDALRDMYTLAIHNIKLSRETQWVVFNISYTWI